MRAAVNRYVSGTPTRLPWRVKRQLIAARYGTTPAAVDAWPADDASDALSLLAATGVSFAVGGDS